MEAILTCAVNAILGDHNVDKQMTDSRGDVSMVDVKAVYVTDCMLGCVSDG